ncbi:hypothetical protein C8F04DRAFT_1185625 [Mycena alexandri]|uniref:Uncharacterized protein n=1 Tax=Mycena alexandri TaxID=1745969 RepID=A0AAD6SR92_9AGAR|nr:hypothetical protein C8F04DRAFT_1185625 [Mycena alexandri]
MALTKTNIRHDAYGSSTRFWLSDHTPGTGVHGHPHAEYGNHCHGRKTHILKLRKEVRATEYGNWAPRAATLQSVAPPSVGPTKVNLGQSFNKEASRVVVEQAVKLLNGQQPNLAACNSWLGPQTQIRARSTTPIVTEGLSDLIITTPQFILTIFTTRTPTELKLLGRTTTA